MLSYRAQCGRTSPILSVLVVLSTALLGVAAQTWRKRVFILAIKPGFKFVQASCSSSKPIFITGHWQDVSKVMSVDDIRSYPVQVWQPGSKPPVAEWLQEELSDVEQQQLKSMGNIVMPQLANLAFNLLCRA